jgi:hypothetical protein
MRFWYPINALERPATGLSRSSFLAMRAGDTTLTEAHEELLTCEKDITRLYCRAALIEAMEISTVSSSDLKGKEVVIIYPHTS